MDPKIHVRIVRRDDGCAGNRDTQPHDKSRDGRKLQPPMGISYYARLSPSDLSAIVAYLRTLPPQPR